MSLLFLTFSSGNRAYGGPLVLENYWKLKTSQSQTILEAILHTLYASSSYIHQHTLALLNKMIAISLSRQAKRCKVQILYVSLSNKQAFLITVKVVKPSPFITSSLLERGYYPRLTPKTIQNYKPFLVPNPKIPMEFRHEPNPYPLIFFR